MRQNRSRREWALLEAVEKAGITRDSPVVALDLSTRLQNILLDNRVKTIGQLASMSEMQLWQIRGIGRHFLIQIKDQLSQHGFRLGMSLKK